MICKKYINLTNYTLGLAIICLVVTSCAQKSNTGCTARLSTVAGVINGKIYLVGGIMPNGITPLVEEYDPLQNRWAKKTSMLTARANAAAVNISDNFYVIGGRRYDDIFSNVERYDSTSDSWTKCSPMLMARWNLMAAAVDDKIYAIGGITGVGDERKILDVVEVYDPSKNIWTKLSPMPVGRSNAAVAVVGNMIYIISGRVGTGATSSVTARVDVYNPAKDTWLEVNSLNQARSGSEACVINNTIYVIGGASGGNVTASIEVYDPLIERWETGLSLKKPRTDHNCSVVGNSIYVLGGMERPSISAILTSVEKLSPSLIAPVTP